MKLLYKLIVFVSLLLIAESIEIRSICPNECKRENNCACPSRQSPLHISDTPQFITLTFDDAITEMLYNDYLTEIFTNRTNPDGKPITATFYVPHSYTNYQLVNKLYNEGHDVSLHSVTKDTVDYWKTATERQLKREFAHNRRIITTFSNISTRHIVGARTPHLQLSGDNTFAAYESIDLQYDSSWVTRSSNPLFPFTLDYPVHEECLIGQRPRKTYPGFWVLPIVNLLGKNDIECNALASCQMEGSATEIGSWLIKQLHRVYYNNRAPITLMINLSWFQMIENSFEGLKIFLDYLQNVNSVYLVSHKEVAAWSRNPVRMSEYKTNYRKLSIKCRPFRTCTLKHQEEERILSICGTCPNVYPWLGNPQGQ